MISIEELVDRRLRKCAEDDKRYERKCQIRNAKAAGYHFSVVGVHTICWTRDRNVWTFSTAIKNPGDRADKYIGKCLAFERFMSGNRVSLRLPNGVHIKEFLNPDHFW